MQTLLIIYCILSVIIALYLSVKFFIKQKGLVKFTALAAFVIYAIAWPVLVAVLIYKIKKIEVPDDL